MATGLRFNRRLSILFGDPGRLNDPFGLCWLEWWPSFRLAQEQRAIPAMVNAAKSTNKPFIRVRAAQQFHRRPFAEVAAWAAQIKRQVKPDIIALESNGQGGKAALAAFRSAGLTTTLAVACQGASCSEDRMRKGTAYSKEAVIAYTRSKFDAGLVIWPRGPWIALLQQQLREFRIYRGPTGATTFKRALGRHDDLAMSFLGAMSVCRRAETEYLEATEPERRAAEAAELAEQEERDRAAAAAAVRPDPPPGAEMQADAIARAKVAARNKRMIAAAPPAAA